VRVFGEAVVARFSRKHSDARNPLERFLRIARAAEWMNLLEAKAGFPAVDYAPTSGTLIFNIGGNKYRLIARVDFELQVLTITDVLTHEKYSRENY